MKKQDVRQAWATFEIKAVDEVPGARREFEGLASTPETDRQGDVVEPMGAQFSLPIPLLWQHDASMPIGAITEAKASKTGIRIRGYVENLTDPPSLKEELDRAWAMIKSKLVRGLSVGFIPLEFEPLDAKQPFGGLRFTAWDWLELSAVTIPANAGASIQTVKSVDLSQMRAASGARGGTVLKNLPPVAGSPSDMQQKGTKVKKTIQEQIGAAEAKRAASAARMDTILEKSSDEGRSFDAAEKQEYEGLKTEVKDLDEHLVTLKEHQSLMVAKAVPAAEDTSDSGAGGRQQQPNEQKGNGGGGYVTWGKSQLPPGIRFARYAMCIANAKGNLMQAEILSRRFNDSSPEVNLALKAAVAAGTTQDATWASPLVQLQEMQSEFVEFLRPQTLLGRIPGLRRVPFNIKFTRQTAGTSGTFVGEGLPKPLGKMDFELLSLQWAKAATIIVLTDELVRFSNPSAETLARDDLAAGIAQYLDKRFIDPTYAGVANVSPASVTHNAPTIASLGNTIALISDTVEAAVRTFITANIGLGSLVWIMSPGTALSLSFRRTTQDIFAFPGLGPNGGTFMGYPVITSNNVLSAGSPGEGQVILMNPSEILLADDGGVSIDMSTEASLQMDSAPSNPVTSSVSLWQSNMVALRAERYINWMKRRDAAVTVIGGVDW